MIILILSIIFLIIAPFLYLGALRFKRTWHAIERAMMILVAALVTFHLLPESIAVGGDETVLIAFFGLFLPSLLEKLWMRYASKIHLLTVLVGVAGLFMETHPDPSKALSDGPNAVPLKHMKALLETLVALDYVTKKTPFLENAFE